MFRKEAAWIARRLAQMDAAKLGTILNIGSSTESFRTVQQPWIDELLFAPIRARGVPVVHLDRKEADGVDLVADIMSDAGTIAASAHEPRTVMLCNVLEHVGEPERLARRAFDLVAPDGQMIVSVPRSYPYHADPIDTMYRPTPKEVAALVPDAVLIEGEILPTIYHWNEIISGVRRPQRKRIRWLFVPYRVTMAVLGKPA